MPENRPVPGTGGDTYVPFDQRTGDTSPKVYFTRDLSPESLTKMLGYIREQLKGRIAVKLHTGEPHGPNIVPPEWVNYLIQNALPDATIIETNTYYEGNRYTTEEHKRTLSINGWDFCPVEIIDADGTVMKPVEGGKWFTEMSLGKGIDDFDSLLVLTHFKGHPMAGFGGSDKNIGIGCADGRLGKKMIHTREGSDNMWSIDGEELMERITESAKATVDHFGDNIVYINVMRNMSVDCDCTGIEAAPVVTPDVGILASTDICAIDSACMDIVFAMSEEENHDLRERITSRHGLRQLSYMHELGMGSDRYTLIDVDGDGEKEITAADAAKDLKPFVAPPKDQWIHPEEHEVGF